MTDHSLENVFFALQSKKLRVTIDNGYNTHTAYLLFISF